MLNDVYVCVCFYVYLHVYYVAAAPEKGQRERVVRHSKSVATHRDKLEKRRSTSRKFEDVATRHEKLGGVATHRGKREGVATQCEKLKGVATHRGKLESVATRREKFGDVATHCDLEPNNGVLFITKRGMSHVT